MFQQQTWHRDVPTTLQALAMKQNLDEARQQGEQFILYFIKVLYISGG